MSIVTPRLLRSNPIEAEAHLWSKLRRGQIEGFRFRRQVRIGPYIIDFACMATRLAIEIDGGQHVMRSEKDALRSKRIEADGFLVVRFWNNDVLANTDGVVDSIRHILLERSAAADLQRRSKSHRSDRNRTA